MTMRWRIALGSLCASILSIILVVIWQRPAEPEYGGHKLSTWLLSFEWIGFGPNSEQSLKVESDKHHNAIRQIGTNALPFLLEWMSAKDSRLRTGWIQVTRRFRIPGVHPLDETQKRWMAFRGFQVLGPAAKPAVPGLISLFQSSDEEVRNLVARSLGSIGPDAKEAVPVLLESLRGKQYPADSSERWAMAEIDPATAANLESALKK